MSTLRAAALRCDGSMTETDAPADRASLVPGVHRLIRAIDGKEGPFPGALVAFDDAVAVCVDIERLGDWDGWAFSDAEHVCGALDIRRRADGHDVLLPWCTQRVEAFLGRRDASDSPLTPGELGTLVVSLLRGVRELGTDAEAVGEWWLTVDGRPLFVHGDGGSARARTAALVERMLRQQSDRGTVRILQEAASALRQPRHPADDDRRWEQELFARAAPRALQIDVFAPERVSAISPRLVAADAASDDTGRSHRRDVAGETRSRRSKRKERPERPEAGAVRVLRSLSEIVRMRMERMRERPPRRTLLHAKAEETGKPKSSRRRALLLAGALGAIVLIVGLLWPGDDGDAPAEAASRKAPAVSEQDEGADRAAEDLSDADESKTSTPGPTPTGPVSDEGTAPDAGTALDAVPRLLDAISGCVKDIAEDCAGAVAEGGRIPTEGVASLGASESTAALVDDYGDVAVIRLTPVDSAMIEQMMVLERRDDIWLVRDVYDVAHQPD
ncbi:hypothetical protein LZG07_02550 [Microbacterium profundi]|uniref:hypothetical protein n=1 Tax=Microbacterium profundi TaxID=450380 RepID=UPI001F24C59C|nr:hypothetical protein [Microbacterium profundi]MCE7480816.1 hypothetical protein [Microbacterium profundi]